MASILDSPLKISIIDNDSAGLSTTVSSADYGNVLLIDNGTGFNYTTTKNTITYKNTTGWNSSSKTFRAVTTNNQTSALNYFVVTSLYNTIDNQVEKFSVKEYDTNTKQLISSNEVVTTTTNPLSRTEYLKLRFYTTTKPIISSTQTPTFPPITITTTSECTTTGQGIIKVTNISGGTGRYTKIAIGNTESTAQQNIVTNPQTLQVGQKTFTFDNLPIGTYWVVVADDSGVRGISSNGIIPCPLPTPSITVGSVDGLCVDGSGKIEIKGIAGGDSGEYYVGYVLASQVQFIGGQPSQVAKTPIGAGVREYTFTDVPDGLYDVYIYQPSTSKGLLAKSGVQIDCKPLENPIEDVVFFEVIFAGNGKDDPDMYQEITSPTGEKQVITRAKLKFDYAQATGKSTEVKDIFGRTIFLPNVTLTSPILNKVVPIFGNTDAITISRKFVEENPTMDLGFELQTDFKQNTSEYPPSQFLLDRLLYTFDVDDAEIADGKFDIDISQISFGDDNKKWKQLFLNSENKFVIDANEIISSQTDTETNTNRLLIVALFNKRRQYVPRVDIPDTDGLKFQVPFSEKDKPRIIEIPYTNLKYANALYVFVDKTTDPPNVRIPVTPTTTEGVIKLSYGDVFNYQPGEKQIQIVPVWESRALDGGTIADRGNGSLFNIKIEAVDDYPNVIRIFHPGTIDIPTYNTLSTIYQLRVRTTLETAYVDIETIFSGSSDYSISSNELNTTPRTKLTRLEIPASTGTERVDFGLGEAAVAVQEYKEFTWDFNVQNIFGQFPEWNAKSIKILVTPYSETKLDDPLFARLNPIKGITYPVITQIKTKTVKLKLADVINVFSEFYLNHLNLKAPKENKYISHLANFGEDNQLLISSWENDNWTLSNKSKDAAGNDIVLPKDEVKSLILKLYNPLPANISKNNTLWITKLLANPLIETVLLQEEINVPSHKLRGANFEIDVDFVTGQSTNYESIDSLILSASVSSSYQLLQNFTKTITNDDTTDVIQTAVTDDLGSTSALAINTDILNIEYVSKPVITYDSTADSSGIYRTPNLNGAPITYENDKTIRDTVVQYEPSASITWNNFVHFSSAKERFDNFIYKVKLIEVYESSISSSKYDPTTSGYGASFSVTKEVEAKKQKRDKIIQNFDGFERFLYTSSSYTRSNYTSLTWPYQNGTRLSSTSSVVLDWYESIAESASDYDKTNSNNLLNNIPAYILSNEDNDQFVLFMSMVGQHFDVIYFFNKAFENSKKIDYSTRSLISNNLLLDKLKSFSWNPTNLAVDAKLWEYFLGLDLDGDVKNNSPVKKRNDEIWRRIINNLPYLLKNKGTKRAIHALMSCYGIPTTNLPIIEFGQKQDDGTGTLKNGKYVFDNITNVLLLPTTGKVSVDWSNSNGLNRKPDTIEIFTKPAYANNWTLVSGSGWGIYVSGSSNSKYGKVLFQSNSTVLISSSLLPVFNGEYFGLELSRTTGSTNYEFELNTIQYKGELLIFSSSVTASVVAANGAVWNTGNQISIGSGYSGSVDEFRLWSNKLSKDRFYEHGAFSEMINGNNISASVNDLSFRLDFEYPKNVASYTTMPNIAPHIYYSSSLTRNYLESNTILNGQNIFSLNTSASFSASLSGFSSVTSYPYQFDVMERSVVLEMPDIGLNRYITDKVRLQDSNVPTNALYPDKRSSVSTAKTTPIDSNHVGLFVSPSREINLDIAKSFGGLNLDDYIGDPRDRYKSNYSSLDALRKDYFKKYNGRDIYAYINLVKFYEQSIFEDVKKLIPARTKLSTGVLIEPHFLERSKVKLEFKRPSGENNNYDSNVVFDDIHDAIAEVTSNDALILNTDTQNSFGENYQQDVETDYTETQTIEGEDYQKYAEFDTTNTIDVGSEYVTKDADIESNAQESTQLKGEAENTMIIGVSDFENLGFGLYIESGSAIQTYRGIDGWTRKRRVRVSVLTVEKTMYYEKYATRLPNGLGDPRGGTIATSSVYTETQLSIQPFTGTSQITAHGEIKAVQIPDGYLSTHYKYVNDLSTGMENSFWRGCKITETSEVDYKPVVEEFTSNPNTLVVNKFGRDANEPILEVD